MKLSTRSTALALVEVVMGNPNGDPDFDGRPRVITDGRGFMTDVSMKHKFRRLFDNHETETFMEIQKLVDMPEETLHICESMGRGSPHTDPQAAIKWMRDFLAKEGEDAFIQRYLDIRLFGTTLLLQDSEDGKKKKADKEEGDAVRLKKTGPVTFSPALSIAPIYIGEQTITKMATGRDALLEKDASDMAPGAKKFVEHGVYAFKIVVNPHVALPTKTTEEDIKALKTSLKHIFNLNGSCSRPVGSMNFIHIWWADHDNSLGSFNEFDFFNHLMPTKIENPKDPSSTLSEYHFPTPDGLAMKVTDLAR